MSRIVEKTANKFIQSSLIVVGFFFFGLQFVHASEVPGCTHQLTSESIAQLALGNLPDGAIENNPGDCLMQLQKQALEDEVALNACPVHFRLRAENRMSFVTLVGLPVQKEDSKYGKLFADDREKLRNSFTKMGCDQRADTYFPFYANDKSNFIERVR